MYPRPIFFALFIGFMFSILGNSPAQTVAPAAKPLAIGQWRTMLPLRNGQYVTQSASKIYYSTGQAILTLDKTENALDLITKVEGLSNSGIELIRYNPGSKTLVVVYDNSVIDLVRDNGKVLTLNQIANFSNIVGKKTIYDLFFEDNNNVLISANFGLSKLNLERGEFVFSTFSNAEVYSTAVFQGYIYAATEAGLYRIQVANPNPENFGNWEFLGASKGFPRSYAAHRLGVFNNQLYFDINNEVFKLVNNLPVSVLRRDGRQLQYLTSEGKNLLLGFRCPTGACFRGEMVSLDASGKQTDVPNDCFSLPNYAIEDEKGRIWFGDVENFRRLNSLSDRNCSTLVFNSPYSEKVREIAIYDNQIWTAAGGVDQRFSYTFTSDGFASYIDGKWTIYNLFNQPVMRGVDPNNGDDDVRDVITIAVNPSNGKVYAGSFLEGLVEKDGDKYTLYNDKNSSLNNTVGDAQRTRVSGLAFDKNNNLWVANHLADRPISVFKTDGKWQSFKPSCFETALHQVAIDRNGYKWFASSSNANGLIVFDEGKLDNPNDDRCRIFNQSNSKLTTNRVNCVQADIDGDVWVGTAEGIIIFECSNPFENSCIGSARAVSENGFLGLLLKTEDIQTIAVDGANRKWVGTKNGVFLLSANGEQQLASFNEKNSPLLSNIITDITVNPSNGEVFIGTQSGINVYQGEATVGDRYNAAAIEVYPNPVRPGYTGSIAMRGLARDAIVKITDVSGQLVFETKALGGQAIWDGRDYQGRKVHSGVYLVLAASNPRDAGFGKPSTAVGKIVFIDQE